MILTYILGAAGAGTLLVAFVLVLFKVVGYRSRTYAILNLLGAGVACYASYRADFSPYMFVHGAWCVVALVGLFRSQRPSTI